MRGYEKHEMTAAMLAPAPEDPDSVDINTLWGFMRDLEDRRSREVLPPYQTPDVGNYPSEVSFVAAKYGIVDDGRAKVEAWLAATKSP